MAFKISKADQKRIASLVNEFGDKRSSVESELASLNETRDELRGVVEDLRDQMESDYDEKSESWQEGDRGRATRDWIDALSDFVSLVEEDFEVPDSVNDVTDALENEVPSEPEY